MDELSSHDEVRRRRGQSKRVRVVGGLPAVSAPVTAKGVLAVLAVTTVFGCEDKASPPAPPKERSQAVQVASAVATMPTAPPSSATPAPAREQRLVLCAQQLGQPPKDAPKSPVSR